MADRETAASALGTKKKGKTHIAETRIKHVKGGHLVTRTMRHADGSMPEGGGQQEEMVPQGGLAQNIQDSGVDDEGADAGAATAGGE